MPMTAGTASFSCTVLAPDGASLPAIVELPEPAAALAILAHGAGSSRASPRGEAFAATLHRFGIGSMRLDLLTGDEAGRRELVFDIPLLADRLEAAIGLASGDPRFGGVPIVLVGASTGAAAALVAASRRPGAVRAIVCRGGRVDLAGTTLDRVTAPTLLAVGEDDRVVLELNRTASERLAGPKDLLVIPGATHLFAEPGALEEVARHAARWILRYAAGRP